MARSFPHMSDSDSFPYVDQVDVWKFKNDFDYSQFDDLQMIVTVCSVPWDVGLIHVGNAQIGGLGNVVAFESERERDEYISGIKDKHVFQTEYRKFHNGAKGGIDGTARLPIPVEACTRFNYIVVEYEELPVALEHYGTRKFFYFIREPRRIATNTTEVDLLLDTWQTFQPGLKMKIPYMMLERGHAPLHAMPASRFLDNPIDGSRYITGEDVNFSRDIGSCVAYANDIIFNDGDSVFACIVLDANMRGNWGDSLATWRVPTTHSATVQGVPTYQCYAIDANQFNDFLATVDAQCPQFKECVKAVFFATERLLTIRSTFEFLGYTFGLASADSKRFEGLVDLSVDKFNYAPEYAHIAKLYTYPYAHIELVKDDGNVEIVRIEDTTGRLDLVASLSAAYPFIHITAHVVGVGGLSRIVSFKNINNRSIRIGGTWQRVKMDWDVPTFAVIQDNATYYNFATYHDRVQKRNDADTANANAKASSATNKANADRLAAASHDNAYDTAATTAANTKTMADAAKANADADANTIVANAELDANANDSNVANRREYNTTSTSINDAYNTRTTGIANGFIQASTETQTAAEKENSVISAIGSAAGAALSASPSGLASAVANYMQAGVTINATAEQAGNQISQNNSGLASSILQSNMANVMANAQMGFDRDVENARVRGQAANTAATMRGNASRTQGANYTTADNAANTERGNADRIYAAEIANSTAARDTANANADRARDNAYEAINNAIRQAALEPVRTFGEFSAGETATTRPQGVFAQIVTQTPGEIAAAGDEMLRFGYQCNMCWKFETWNLMPKFTYWKASDISIDGLSIPDKYADGIRFALMGGICVWRKPEYIGRTSIYENWE